MPPPLLALPGSSEFRRRLQMVVQAGPVSPLFGAVLFACSRRELEELIRRHPSSPAVVDAAVMPESASHPLLASAVRLGANAPLGVIARSVLPGIDPEQPRRLQARIRKHAAPEACRILAQVLARSFWPSTVPELAASLELSHWTLIRRCRSLGIPTPKKLNDLGRVYTVERLAEWSEQPSGVAAAAVGFMEPANYRRTVRRALGVPPSVVRQRGGAAHVGRVIARHLTPATAPSSTPPSDGAKN